jgi:hypothetical protein
LNRRIGAGKTDISAIRFPRDRDRLRGTLHRPTPSYCDAPDLGEDQKVVIQPSATVVPNLWVGETVVAISALEAGIAGCGAIAYALKERLKRSIGTEHDILQDLGINLGVLRHCLLDIGQLSLLLEIRNRNSTHPPCFPTLANGGVIDLAAEQKGTIKFPVLFLGGLKYVFVGLANAAGLFFHGILFCLVGAKAATARTFVAQQGHLA